MGPLTELMGLNPEAAVTALQFANQTINTISPVAGMTVAGLAVAKISFGQWWKTIWKFFIFHGRLWPDRNGNLWHASGVGGCDV